MSASQELVRIGKVSFFAASNVLTGLALIGQMRDPDLPSFQSVSTDLLNPWKTWLLYGCAWNHCGGPYSLFWYWAMIGLSLGGRLTFVWPLFILNGLLQLLVMSKRIFLPYVMTSSVTLMAYPQNMIIVFLLLLGFFSRWGTVLAPLFKLPLFAPLYVWRFILTAPTSVHEPDNWPVYAVLGVWWIVGIFYLRRTKGQQRKWMLTEQMV